MANSNPSRPGLREGGSDALELMLDVRGGEVLTAYNTAVIMADKHKTQQLRGAKSVKFPAFWNASAEYHVPGTEITGGQIAGDRRRSINPWKPTRLLAWMRYQIDPMLSVWDAPWSTASSSATAAAPPAISNATPSQ